MEKSVVIEGSMGVAEAVKACKPHVVAAYPITPQTHIVEDISQMVADGEMDCEYVRVESEFSACSTVLGASAAGARVYSSTASQGLLLMGEVVYSVAGMRLPVVMTIANRAVSAPLSIWNDHQDSIAMRDSGWIQFYVEDNQEAMDATLQAYKIAEDHDVLLPAMVSMDGFVLTHTYEPVELYDQEKVDEFLPPREPLFKLDPEDPKTMGAFADPSLYTETRYQIEQAMENAKSKIEEVAAEFEETFGRNYGGLIDTYRTEDAEVIILAMGSVVGTIKDVVDEYRDAGEKVGLVKIRAYRPFPKEKILEAVEGARAIATIDKNVCLGFEGGALYHDVKSALYTNADVPVLGFIMGVGGRDIPLEDIRTVVNKTQRAADGEDYEDVEFVALRREVL